MILTLLTGVWSALAGPADLPLARYHAARTAGDSLGAWALAGDALKADPTDWRAHRAWQAELERLGATWWLDAEYEALAGSADADLRLMAAGWRSLRSGTELVGAEGARVEAIGLVTADLALGRGAAKQALKALDGVVSPEASALRIEALIALGDTGGLRREVRDATGRWPERVDLSGALWRAESLALKTARWGVLDAAAASLEQADALAAYRAHTLFLTAQDEPLAAAAAARLVQLGEVWALPSRAPWTSDMIRDLGRLLALQSTPAPPPGGTEAERARVLAATARELGRRGRHERAAEVWRQAIQSPALSAELLIEGAAALERVGAPPEELIALARRARALSLRRAAMPDELPHDQQLRVETWLIEARALRRAGDLEGALAAAVAATDAGAAAEVWVLRGELLEQLGDPVAAFTTYAFAASLGVTGMEERLNRLYAGPASAADVVGAWPKPSAAPVPSTVSAAPRFPVRAVQTRQGAVDLNAEPLIVVAFWASWCVPCAAELPELDKLAGRLAAQGIPVKIVAISVDEQERDYTRWLTNRELNQLIIGRDPALAREAKVTGIPSTWVLGPGGVVLAFHQGYVPGDIDKLEEELRSAAAAR
ncbi:MAG: redoxin domain-containing protein [Deltaproteobacteria bacterium]|nr:redoxin domain-containing protein [Deltaproteobacteria bacterium]